MNTLTLVIILAVVFGGGFLMDRMRKFRVWYFVEYCALATPLILAFGARGPAAAGKIALAYVLTVVLLYMLARLNWHATFVPTGEIKFIIRGETLERVIENVVGHHIEYDAVTGMWTMAPGEKADAYESFITRWFGIYWVSILFPLKRVHAYTFDWTNLHTGTKPTEEKGKVETVSEEGKYYLQHRHEVVNSLFFRYAYPVVAVEVEIKGNMSINIMALITTEVVNPEKPIFLYKGRWLEPVMSAVRDAIAGFVHDMNIDEVRKNLTKATGGEFQQFIMEKVRNELVDKVGIAVTKVDFIRYDLAGASQAVRNAVTAQEVARLEAEADIERGRGEGERNWRKLEGLARGYGAVGASAQGDSMRAQVISAHIQGDAVREFQGTVLAGAGTPVLVSGDGENKKGERKKEKEKE